MCFSSQFVALKLVSEASLPPLSRQLKSTREIVSLLWWIFPTVSLCGKGGVGVLEIRKEGVRRQPPFENPNLIFPGPMPVSMETTAGSRNGNQNPEMQSLELLLISLAGFQFPFPQGN
ncbi:proprotein convertase subtilisin/kexin type 6 [Platysternon megacephalum]|uniref:Proprotein convertase subtilisin/kexin type 6 n=1 Tax=Platysternon megacephalum TaxID=55544 RepID=A0A4D9EY17_9SAUR|nr:proprotein convertase subtilisin/kexin type 6 [Platysternon megacephalum]